MTSSTWFDPRVLADELEVGVGLVERDDHPDAEAGGERACQHSDELHPLGPSVGEQRNEERPDGGDQDQRCEDGERHRLPRTTMNHTSTKTTPTPIAAA